MHLVFTFALCVFARMQDLWLCREEEWKQHGERVSPFRRARPRATGQCYRQLRLQGDDWLSEGQIKSNVPFFQAFLYSSLG